MTTPRQPGKIVTFYSYKGGTGRSMALANVAWILASNGLKVLTVDWDLEAPGLHRYFHPFLLDPELSGTPGLLDMVWTASTAALDPSTATGTDRQSSFADVLDYAVSLRHEFPHRGSLDLLPAGRQNDLYSTRVGAFDWTSFYERLGGGAFFEAMRASMRAAYDYVLIDSRTGLSDTSGICTVQMPDAVVVAFTYNTQSIVGASAVARSITRQRSDLRILPVPMRVEDGEKLRLERARDFARDRFAGFPADLDDAERVRYWGESEVPYQAFYAYEEILAPIGDRPRVAGTVLRASERLVARLTHGLATELVPLPEEDRRRLLQRVERSALAPAADIALHYVPADRAWAAWLTWQLETRGYVVADLGVTAPTPLQTPPVAVVVASPAWVDGVRTDPVASPTVVQVTVAHLPAETGPRSDLTVDIVDTAEASVLGLLEETLAAFPGPFRRTTPRRPGGAPRFPGSLPDVWNVPPRNESFTGREGLLSRIAQSLPDRPVVLAGLGGVGKTATAAEYAHRHRADYDIVWWIQDADRAGATSLAALGDALGLPAALDAERAAVQALDTLRARGRWLVVLDEVEDPSVLTRFSGLERGHLLLTSRYSVWRGLADVIFLAEMTRAESVTFLRQQACLDTEVADELAAALGDLPLALSMAAALVAETGMPVADYLRLLNKQSKRLLSRSDHSGDSVAGAFALSLAQLRGASPAGFALLELLSLFGHAPVPLRIVTSASGVVDDDLRGALSDPLELAEMVAALNRYSLASRDGDYFHVHRLVQTVVRDRLADDDRRRLSVQVEGLLAAAAPGPPEEPATWSAYMELLPHVTAVDTCQDAGFRSVLLASAWYLYHRGLPGACRDVAEGAVALFRPALGEEADDTLAALHVLAIALWALGEVDTARTLNENVLATRERLHGPTHPATLSSMSNLALSLVSREEFTSALPLLESVFDTRRHVLGPDHADTLAALGNLAVGYYRLGRLDDARGAAEEAVARSRSAGNRAATITALNNLAVVVAAQGDEARAADLYRRVTAERRELLGPQHPETLNAMYNLACVLLKLRGPEDEEARSLARSASDGLTSGLGPDHPAAVRAQRLATSLAPSGSGIPEAEPT